MTAIMSSSSFHTEKSLNVEKPILVRNLKDWRWELRGKKVAIVNKKARTEEGLAKVRFISLIKFSSSALDKMRIEESKQFRAKIRKIKEGYKERINKQRISAKARKKEK